MENKTLSKHLIERTYKEYRNPKNSQAIRKRPKVVSQHTIETFKYNPLYNKVIFGV